MKKPLLLLAVIAFFSFSIDAQPGCDFSGNQYPAATITVNSNNAPLDVDECNYAGENNLTTGYIDGMRYEFSSSVGTDYLTIRNATTNDSLAHAEGTVTLIYSGADDIECHIGLNMSCATEDVCRVITITCLNCPAGTPPECATLNTPPDGANVDADTTFTWTPSSTGLTPTGYNFYLGTDMNDLANIGTVTDTFTGITGLNNGNTYFWSIVPVIDGAEAVGCAVFSFTTPPCVVVPSPHAELFDAAQSIPTDWVSLAGFWLVESEGFEGNTLHSNQYNGDPTGVINSLPVGPIQTGDELRFKARAVNYTAYPAGPGPAAGFGTMRTFISTDCGQSFTLLQTDGDNLSGIAWQDITIDLTPYVGDEVVFRFFSSWVSGDYYMDIDNFEVGPVPSSLECALNHSPADASAGVPLECGDQLTLNWDENSFGLTPDSYDVYFGTSAGSLTLEGNTVDTEYPLSGILANTDYFYKIVPKLGLAEATCDEYSFSTGSSSDGGSGGISNIYYFANNNNAAGASNPYSYDDPMALGHAEITTPTSGSIDDGYMKVPLPFTFQFYGVDYDTAYIGTNGYVSFESGYTITGGSTNLGTTAIPDNMIAAVMMDLDTIGTDGKILYGPISPSLFGITWYHMHDFGDANEWITVQLVLQKNPDELENGSFEIRYNESESSSSVFDFLADAVVGCEDIAANATTEFASYREDGVGGPMFCSPLAIGFAANEPGVALPLELLSFEGREKGATNMLTWTTVNESNTDKIQIERSENGSDWKMIGSVQAQGNRLGQTDYSYVDDRPMQSSYYRLKIMDKDNRYDFSTIISINRNDAEKKEMAIYPNPFGDQLNVTLSASGDRVLNVQIYDVQGKLVLSTPLKVQAGLNQLNIDTRSISTGVYLLSIQGDAYNIQQKVVKF